MKNLYSSLMVIAAFVLFGPSSAAGLVSESEKEIQALKRVNLSGQRNGAVGSDQEPGHGSKKSPSMIQGSQFNALSVCYRIRTGGRNEASTVEDLTGFVNQTQLRPSRSSGLWILLPASGNVASRVSRISDLFVVCARWTKP